MNISCKSYTFMEQETSQPASVVVGDVADEVRVAFYCLKVGSLEQRIALTL